MNLLVPLLADLPSATIDTVLGYVTQLTNLTDLDIAPKAFAVGDFGSSLKAFIGNAKTWAEVRDARFTKTTAEDGTVTYAIKDFDFGIANLNDLVNFVCDLTAPLNDILALILMGGQDGVASAEALSILGEVNVMGGNGYNYAIIPLLELLGIDAMSQAAYNSAVQNNNGSVLYPILNQLVTKVMGVGGILENPVNWLADILANLCYVLGTDQISTIVDNLIAPINGLIAKVDKFIPIAITVDILADAQKTVNVAVNTYINKDHPGVGAGIHVNVKGEEIAEILENVLSGIVIEGVIDDGIIVDLNWLDLAAKIAEEDANGMLKTDATKFTNKLDKYNSDNYRTIVGNAGDTFITLIDIVLKAVDVKSLIEGIEGIPDVLKDLIDDILEDPTNIAGILGMFFSEPQYQPIQNRPIDTDGNSIDYRNYLTFTEQNADVIAENIDQVVVDVLKGAGLINNSLSEFVGTFITQDLLNNLLNTIFGLLAGNSVAPILTTVKGLEFHVKNSKEEANTDDNRLVIDLTVQGFYKALTSKLQISGKHSYMAPFVNELKRAMDAAGYEKNQETGELVSKATWANVKASNINWNMKTGDIQMLAKVLGGVLVPLYEVLELLLIGEGRYLNVLGLIDIQGGAGYDYAIIPLIEALGFASGDVWTAQKYAKEVANDYTNVLGYVLKKVADLVDNLLGSKKPIYELLTRLPNLAYFFSNDGLLLTVKNLLAPVYPILELLLPALGLDITQYLDLEALLASVGKFPIDLNKFGKFTLHLPELDLYELASQGAKKIPDKKNAGTKEVSTSRSNPGNDSVGPWANSFKQAMTASEYKAYVENRDINDNSLYKNTQTVIVADAGNTLVYLLSWVFRIFSTEANRDSLVDWICEFFELKEGARATVKQGIEDLYNHAKKFNSSDIIVSALLAALGMTVTIEATLMGNVQLIQSIFETLFGAIADGSQCTYGAIAKTLEELTGVWDDTIGSEDDYEDAVEDAEVTLNWFQKIIKKIKDFFAKIFGIFK
jgi:hypothetical protein